MTRNEPATCGRGLAERSALPARLSALSAAMADVLEQHQRTLDLKDPNARTEHKAYETLARDYRDHAAQLQNTADRMASYESLPMAQHDARAMAAPEMGDAFATLIEREHHVVKLLESWIEQDEGMLAAMRRSAAGSEAGPRLETKMDTHDIR